MPGWVSYKLIVSYKIGGRNNNNLRYADVTTLMVESKEELKSLLMRMKKESERTGLKLNIKTKIMASDPITAWQIEGEKVEVVTDFLFLGSKIIVDGDCVLPDVRIPREGREKASKTMQLAKKGKFITDSNQGSCRTSNTVVRGQRALSRGGYPNL